MNVLIIGGNGFIGSHLTDQLITLGHRVRVFDQVREKFRPPLPNVDYRIASLDNFPELYESFLDIDIVFHLASASVPSTSNIDILTDVQKNLVSTLNVLNLAVKFKIHKFIYFSSGGAVYGMTNGKPIAEEHRLNPISSYGILKMTTEHYIRLYEKLHKLIALTIRPSNPYGTRQGHYIAQGVISTFLRKIASHEPLIIQGNGTAIKDYIYIDDLINATCKLCFSKSTGIYNLGSGTGTDLLTVISAIESVTGISPVKEFIEPQSYDVSRFVLDISKAQKQINWSPKVSLNDGITNVWKWLCSEK